MQKVKALVNIEVKCSGKINAENHFAHNPVRPLERCVSHTNQSDTLVGEDCPNRPKPNIGKCDPLCL
jgi:hypothetical protein